MGEVGIFRRVYERLTVNLGRVFIGVDKVIFGRCVYGGDEGL